MSRDAASDGAVLAEWWQHVRARGELPPTLVPVQGRLIRAVGRGELPSGPVFAKLMTFPRSKDRLRYALRGLPAEREAAMLRAVAAAGIPCPEVVAVRTARRGGLPFRSLLVLRALPVAAASAAAGTPALAPRQQLAQQAALARRLLDAGLFHPDLNPDNFVRLASGELAILDLQSMRRAPSRAHAGRAMAARLLLEAVDVPVADAVAVLADAGLVVAADQALIPLAARECTRFLRTRVRRCLQTSTEFVCARTAAQVEHRRRGELPPGRWIVGGRELGRAWLGQRLLEVFERCSPVLSGWRRSAWWLPARQSVYVPASVSEERVQSVLRSLTEGCARHGWLWNGRPRDLDELRLARARHLAE